MDEREAKLLRRKLLEARDSTESFGRLCFPEALYRNAAPNSGHRGFFRLLDDDSLRLVNIAAPRGWGKTTWDTLIFPARRIVFQQSKFILIISATGDVAKRNVKNLARELTGNSRIVELCGNLRGTVWAEGKGEIETSTGITVLGLGSGQQVRGLIEKYSRPDLIILDDLQESEPFRGDPTEYLRRLKDWFWSDLINSMDIRRTRIINVGTVLHEDCIVSTLLDDPDWASLRIDLCDDSYKSNFPDFMSDEEVAKLGAGFERRGQLDTFFREFRNLPIASKDAVFTSDVFKHYDPYELEGRYIDKMVLVDPAKTVKIHSDYTAVECWGFDSVLNRIYLFDLVRAKLYPEQIYETAWDMARRHKTFNIKAEVTSLNAFMTYPFNQFLRQKGFPPIGELSARGKKQDRIAQLAPLYRMGSVYHNPDKKICGPLEAELLTFPRGKFDDCADCAGYLIPAFEIESKFFALEEADAPEDMEAALTLLNEMDMEEMPAQTNYQWAP